jgi:hypothetical protein
MLHLQAQGVFIYFLACEFAGLGTLPQISPYLDSAERAAAGADTKLLFLQYSKATLNGNLFPCFWTASLCWQYSYF